MRFATLAAVIAGLMTATVTIADEQTMSPIPGAETAQVSQAEHIMTVLSSKSRECARAGKDCTWDKCCDGRYCRQSRSGTTCR